MGTWKFSAPFFVNHLSPRSSGFDPGSDSVRSALGKVSLAQGYSYYFGFPLSVSFHHYSILIHPSTTDAVQPYQLTTSLNNISQKFWPVCTDRSIVLSRSVCMFHFIFTSRQFIFYNEFYERYFDDICLFFSVYLLYEWGSRNMQLVYE